MTPTTAQPWWPEPIRRAAPAEASSPNTVRASAADAEASQPVADGSEAPLDTAAPASVEHDVSYIAYIAAERSA